MFGQEAVDHRLEFYTGCSGASSPSAHSRRYHCAEIALYGTRPRGILRNKRHPPRIPSLGAYVSGPGPVRWLTVWPLQVRAMIFSRQTRLKAHAPRSAETTSIQMSGLNHQSSFDIGPTVASESYAAVGLARTACDEDYKVEIVRKQTHI